MSRDYHALTEMMNELHDPRGLKRFADDVFQGVVPIRNRDKYDRHRAVHGHAPSVGDPEKRSGEGFV